MKKKQELNLKLFITNRKHMGVAIALATVAAMLVFFAIIPQFKEFIDLRSELNKETPKLEKLQQKLVELENVQFTPEFAQAEIVEEALPSKKPLLELLTSLNTIAVASSVRIENFDLNPGLIASNTAELQDTTKQTSSAKDGVDTLDVSMDAVGTFENIQKFLIDLEKISPFTTINTLSLSSRSRGDEFNNEDADVQATLTTKSHFFTQTVSAAVEAPLPTLSDKELEVLSELSQFSTSDLPEQIEITGGGMEDLFGVDPLIFE